MHQPVQGPAQRVARDRRTRKRLDQLRRHLQHEVRRAGKRGLAEQLHRLLCQVITSLDRWRPRPVVRWPDLKAPCPRCAAEAVAIVPAGGDSLVPIDFLCAACAWRDAAPPTPSYARLKADVYLGMLQTYHAQARAARERMAGHQVYGKIYRQTLERKREAQRMLVCLRAQRAHGAWVHGWDLFATDGDL